jgi:hypothetical protein
LYAAFLVPVAALFALMLPEPPDEQPLLEPTD